MGEEKEKYSQAKVTFLRKWLPVIFFGALGSGLWMLIGSPVADWIKDTFVEFGSLFFSSYLDRLHANIGKGFHEGTADFFQILLLVTLTLTVLFLPFAINEIRKIIINDKEKAESINIKKSRIKITIMFYASLVLAIFFTPIYISGIIETTYNNNAVVFIERSVEMLAPYISDKERLLLRSEYRAIDSADDFYRFEEKLRRLSKENVIELPKFSSYK